MLDRFITLSSWRTWSKFSLVINNSSSRISSSNCSYHFSMIYLGFLMILENAALLPTWLSVWLKILNSIDRRSPSFWRVKNWLLKQFSSGMLADGDVPIKTGSDNDGLADSGVCRVHSAPPFELKAINVWPWFYVTITRSIVC